MKKTIWHASKWQWDIHAWCFYWKKLVRQLLSCSWIRHLSFILLWGRGGELFAMNKPNVPTEGLGTIVGSRCRNKDKLWWLSNEASICIPNCLKMPASSIISLVCICFRPPSSPPQQNQLPPFKFILIIFSFFHLCAQFWGRRMIYSSYIPWPFLPSCRY